MLMHPIPYVTAKQMIEVDMLMMDYYKIGLAQMMENAGRNLALLAKNQFKLQEGDNVLVLVGSGGNGGGALVAARRLACWGMDVSVQFSNPREELKQVTRHQMGILEKMNIPFIESLNGRHFHLIIDGLIGYSLHGSPTGRVAEMIRSANANPAPILSLDVPSGMDSTSGEIFDPCINADFTMTLALPKSGFLNPKGKEKLGELFLADISVPPELYQKMGLMEAAFPIFLENEIIRLF